MRSHTQAKQNKSSTNIRIKHLGNINIIGYVVLTHKKGIDHTKNMYRRHKNFLDKIFKNWWFNTLKKGLNTQDKGLNANKK